MRIKNIRIAWTLSFVGFVIISIFNKFYNDIIFEKTILILFSLMILFLLLDIIVNIKLYLKTRKLLKQWQKIKSQ